MFFCPDKFHVDLKNKVFVKKIARSCKQGKCPVCWRKWPGKEAAKIEHRLLEARRRIERLGKPIHLIVSVSQEDYEDFTDDHKKIRQKVQRMLKKVGFKGGAIIPHPWRRLCPKCGRVVEHHEAFKTCIRCGNEGWK